MSRQSIRIEHPAERVTRIMLARPEKRNAQDPPLLYEFDQALADAAADRDTRVIIVGADGPDFSSGHDLSCPFTMPCNPVATLDNAFGLHSLAHAHNLKQFDSLIDPAGIDIIRRSSRHS